MKRSFYHRIRETLFCIRLPLIIIERLYGKEYAVYNTKKCVKQKYMYSFIVHLLASHKISHKIHASLMPY